MGGNGGGFKAYNDHEQATAHSAKTNPWVRIKGRSGEGKEIGRQVAVHEGRLEESRVWLKTVRDESCAFEPSARFNGARAGTVFKLGAQGLGYYEDDSRWVDAADIPHVALVVARPCIFFDLTVSGRIFGRIVIRLWADVAPRMCADFLSLVIGGLGTSMNAVSPQRLHYRGSRLHRIEKGVAVHGGLLEGADSALAATGTATLLPPLAEGATPAKHTQAGFLSSDGEGPAGSHTSRWLLTLGSCGPRFDGRKLIFGQVCSGLPTLLELERIPVLSNHANGFACEPEGLVMISECGLVQPTETGPGEAEAGAGDDARALEARALPLSAAQLDLATQQTAQRVGSAVEQGLAKAGGLGAALAHKRPRDETDPRARGQDGCLQAGKPAPAPSALGSRWSAALDEDLSSSSSEPEPEAK